VQAAQEVQADLAKCKLRDPPVSFWQLMPIGFWE
jgi:hypothetical protein